MRLLLLGDLHFFQLGVWPYQLLSKRLLGQTNLWFNRRRHFRLSLWPAIRDRVRALAPDGLLCSGDFTTTALPGEFRQAAAHWRELIEDLSLPAGAHVVPGNHDRYSYSSKRRQLFERAFAPWTRDRWPALWHLSPEVDLIGLDATRPNRFNASGCLGVLQRAQLVSLMNEIPPDRRLIILCHYPIGTPPGFPREASGHGLVDRAELVELLAKSEREIHYLHGHIHQPWAWKPPEAPRVLAVNAGAPLLTGPHYPMGQGFAELEIQSTGVDLVRHVMSADGEWIREIPSSPGVD